MEFMSPANASLEQRKANGAALQDRIANAMTRVASDKTQSAKVRNSNARDAQTARQMATQMRQS